MGGEEDSFHEELTDISNLGDESSRRVQGRSNRQRLILLAMVDTDVVQFDLIDGVRYDVGRSTDNKIQLNDTSVSRKHAQICVIGGVVVVVDCGSSNGTFVNGKRVPEDGSAETKVGDAIRFGEVVVQLRESSITSPIDSMITTPAQFDVLVAREAERCIRDDTGFAVIAIGVAGPDKRTTGILLSNVRHFTALTERNSERYDVLVLNTDLDGGRSCAERIIERLEEANIEARAGVASFPSAAPSAAGIGLAAEMALGRAESSGVAVFGGSTRRIRLPSKEILIADASMLRLFGLIERVAISSVSALIQGETGTGKEIVAEALHALGSRADGPLVKLNCAAIPETLMESEIFGHVKGAFSGATADKVGLFEQADGGTLFLDEIGDMPLNLQAKLLRVLDDKVVRQVGGRTDKKIDVRVVAATHHDLRDAVAEKRFREDLFFRISSVILDVPPLRERPRDIEVLATQFISELAEQDGVAVPAISADALEALCSHKWPGNIRELRNVMATALIHATGGTIQASDLALIGASTRPSNQSAEPDSASVPAAVEPDEAAVRGGKTLDVELKAIERDRIVAALEECDFNQTKAAKLLGMPRRTLVYKLRSLDIEVPRRRGSRRRS